MPKYKVKRQFLLQGRDGEGRLISPRLFNIGEEVDYDGLPSDNLEPLCAKGRKLHQEYLDKREEQRKAAAINASADARAAAAALSDLVGAAIAQALKQHLGKAA